MDRYNNERWSFSKGKRRKIILKNLENRRHPWIGHTIRHNEFVVNILEGATFGEKAAGRPRPQYLKQVARNTAAGSYTLIKKMTCNNSRWKAANQSKDWGIRRRRLLSSRTIVYASYLIRYHLYGLILNIARNRRNKNHKQNFHCCKFCLCDDPYASIVRVFFFSTPAIVYLGLLLDLPVGVVVARARRTSSTTLKW